MRLCVLIPAFNEAKVIRRTIRSCMDAGMSRADIYVVDDGSGDGTAEIAQTCGVRVYAKPNSGKADSLWCGFHFFGLRELYTHVAVLDADSQVSADYFITMLAAAQTYPNAALLCGGPRSLPHNWLTAYRAVEYAISLGIYREAQSFMGVINVAPGCASVYRTDVFATLHFDGDTLVEDMDLTMQLQRRGADIRYVPDAVVYTQDPATIRGFIGQLKRWYRGTWQVVRKHRIARQGQGIDFEVGLMLAEGLLFGGTLLVLPILLYLYPFFVGLSIGLDQGLLLAFTLLVARRERRADVLWAFPTFIIPRLLNSAIFLWAFVVERRPGQMTWYSVARY